MDDQKTDDFEWDARLREGLTAMADRAPHDPDLSGTLRRRARRRRRRTTVLLGVASLVAVGVLWAVGASGGSDSSPGPTSSGHGDEAYSCPASTPVAVLPAWARAGFSESRPEMPSVLGDEGLIVAIVFGEPLTAPVSADHFNKVLWVARAGSGLAHHQGPAQPRCHAHRRQAPGAGTVVPGPAHTRLLAPRPVVGRPDRHDEHPRARAVSTRGRPMLMRRRAQGLETVRSSPDRAARRRPTSTRARMRGCISSEGRASMPMTRMKVAATVGSSCAAGSSRCM